MRKCVSLTSASSIGFLVLVILYLTVALQGQTKPPASGATGGAGAVLVDTDDSCRLALDGGDQGVVKPDEPKKISVKFGDHILKCTVEGIPDLTWRKVIEVKNSEQVAVLISLKALHIQYEEATAKLEKSKPPSLPSSSRETTVPNNSLLRYTPSDDTGLGLWRAKSITVARSEVMQVGASITEYRFQIDFTIPAKRTDDQFNLIKVYEDKSGAPGTSMFPSIQGNWKSGDRVSFHVDVPKYFADPALGWALRFCVGSSRSCIPSPNLLTGEVISGK